MKKLEEMTRKELAEIIVNDQIRRKVIKPENKEIQIKARLKGLGCSKPMSWSDLYKAAKNFI